MATITEKNISQALLKAEIELAADQVRATGLTPDYSFLTRNVYHRAGLTDKYMEFKCSGRNGSFMSTLPE